MTWKASENPFTGEDHIALLQLMTRRAMVERRRRAAEQQGNREDPDGDQGIAEESGGGAQCWELVPPDVQLYDWQRECLPLWLEKGRGTVKVATGGGKTLFALAAATALQNSLEPNLRAVIVVPTIPLMFQWYDEVRQGNLAASQIGMMGGGQDPGSLDSLFVLICVLASARKRLPSLIKKAGWADHMLLIVDECHRASANHASRIFRTKPKYTLGLSATPEQELGDEAAAADEAYKKGVVGKALGPIIYELTLKQSLEAGLLTPFEVWHVGLPLNSAEAVEHGRLSREISELRKQLQVRHRRSRSKQGFLAWCQTQVSRSASSAAEAERFIGLANQRKRLLYKADARLQVTLGLLAEAAADQDAQTIVFHESIEEIEDLFLAAVARGMPAVLEHSQLPDSLRGENIDAFRRGVARAIISAKSLVEGFNVPSAELGVIAASSGSVRQRVQSLGRMLRRKRRGRTARIAVLYVRDTEDEVIYEKADWHEIVGAERNRYFSWTPPADSSQPWDAGLRESDTPPREFRPSSFDIDISGLQLGDPYPARTIGVHLKVDHSGNLRTEDGALVTAPADLVDAIVERSPYRRARRTPAGHLIVRVDNGQSKSADWRFVGVVPEPQEAPEQGTIRLRVQRVSGRRELARLDEAKRGVVRFALGPDKARDRVAGETRDRLLKWIKQLEVERGPVKEVLWDGQTTYWVEVKNKRIPFEGPTTPLEFQQ